LSKLAIAKNNRRYYMAKPIHIYRDTAIAIK